MNFFATKVADGMKFISNRISFDSVKLLHALCLAAVIDFRYVSNLVEMSKSVQRMVFVFALEVGPCTVRIQRVRYALE